MKSEFSKLILTVVMFVLVLVAISFLICLKLGGL